MSLHLSEIWIYPIKSAGGIRVPAADLSPTGLRHDRRWMLVDPDGRFVSQRECATMARLRMRLDAEGLHCAWDGQLTDSLSLPLPPYELPSRSVTVWRSQVSAQCFPEPVGRWFSQHLERPLQLVYLPDSSFRETNPDYAPGRQVSFADGYPYLLTNQASLDDLNGRLAQPVPMTRFRPNLVISGAQAYAEDQWQRLQIGEAVFEIVKPCERCVMITQDQQTGVGGPEPLRTLAGYRRLNGKVIFGQNAVARSLSGRVQTGDIVS